MARKAPAKTTKKEVVETYQQSLAEVGLAPSVAKPESQLDKKKTEIIEKANLQSTAEIVHEIADLKLKFSAELDELTKNLIVEKEKLSAVQEGVSMENSKLKELYEIEASAASLEALILSQQLKKEEFEKEMTREKEEFEEEMRTKKAEWEREQKDQLRDEKEKEDQLKKKWARMEEEYEYKYKLKQQQDEDQYALKKSSLEQALATRKAEVEKNLQEREAKIAAQEHEFSVLRDEKATFTQALERKIEETKLMVTNELEQKYKFTIELKSKEAEGQISLLKQKIELLEGKLVERQKATDDMAKQLHAAQVQSQELARQVIEGASRAKSFVIHEAMEKERKRETEKV